MIDDYIFAEATYQKIPKQNEYFTDAQRNIAFNYSRENGFDDIENKLNISEKIQYLEPVITVSTSKKFSKIFRQSLVLELYWEENIEFNLILKKKSDFQKISRLTLFRKFLSKYLRNVLRKN